MLADDVRVERELRLEAPVEEVWAALTEPGRLSAWVGGEVTELELRPGGRGTVRRPDGAVRRLLVEAVEPRRLLALRWWPFEEGGPAVAASGSRVVFELEPAGAGTALRVAEAAPPGVGAGEPPVPRPPEPTTPRASPGTGIRAAVG